MCRSATCNTCEKRTWWGCGQHVPSVMDSVPEDERCTCEPQVEKTGKQYPPMAKNNPLLAGFTGLFGGGKAKKSEEKDEKDDGESVGEKTGGK